MRRPTNVRGLLFRAAAALALVAAGCSTGSATAPVHHRHARASRPTASTSPTQPRTHRRARLAPQFRNPLPGMPPVVGNDIYAAAAAGRVSARIAHDPPYLYVPNSYGAPITTVISQRTHRVVRILHTGTLSQHVTPSWDLRTLYVEASGSNELVAINPRTARIVRRIPMPRPYNLYFTPNGRRAVVMAEQDDEIIFTTPHRFRRIAVVRDTSCRGPNHADFSANGRYLVVTCEFSGSLLQISTIGHRVLRRLNLGVGSQPQDVRLSPDGRTFYVAEMGRNRLVRLGWRRLGIKGYIATPMMPHGIYPSRDGRRLFVSDRGAGKVSVVSLATNKVVDTWTIPGGGTPDMGGISADGKVLWLSGRYSGEVYGWNTTTGRLIARIRVGGDPHGIAVWPQPGRYSLGHTGSMR
jgi:DNA-binding beta-propeller fold protein YncE